MTYDGGLSIFSTCGTSTVTWYGPLNSSMVHQKYRKEQYD